MNNWIKLSGSIVLATLLLSGCNSATNDTTTDGGTGNSSSTGTEKVAAEKSVQARLEMAKTAQTLAARIEGGGLTRIEQIQIANGFPPVDVATELKKFVDEGLASGTITQEQADLIYAADVNEVYIELVSGISVNSLDPDSAKATQRGLGSLLKDALNKLAASSVGQKLGGAVFDKVLDSDGITVVMVDAARKSRTVTDAMIDILGEQSNWDKITPKMYPLLRENTEFGEKFAALAYEMNPEEKDGAPAMGRFFFSMVDTGMFDALADAMVLSDDDSVHDDSVEYSTTGYMGQLMIRHAKQFFIKPGTGVQADLSTASGNSYGSTDAFANLLFDTGAPVEDNNGKETGHGDASELAGEKFFYAMFRTPTATGDFVSAMKKVQSQENGQAIVTMFMDKIFLGQGIDANVSADTVQGYYNIESIAGAMNDGVTKYGINSYLSSFKGFYDLVPADSFYPYAKAFINAGLNTIDSNKLSEIWANTTDSVYGYVLGEDNATETNTTEVAAAKGFRASDANETTGTGTVGTPWSSVVWGCTGKAWEELSIWDSITGVFSDNNTTDSTKPGAVDTLSTCLHDAVELSVQEDIVADSKLDNNASTDVTLEEAKTKFTLPSFTDITFKYVYTGAYDRAALHADFFYIDSIQGISDWWTNVNIIDELTGAYDYTKGFVFGSSEERWAYFPSWLSDTQWLDLEKYYATGETTLTVDFSSGVVDFYVLSQDENLTETVKGLNETMVRIETADLPESVSKDLNLDKIKEEDLTSYYVYKIAITDTTGLDEILTALKDYISGFGADTTGANAETNTTAAQ